jgi:hypothetical protein
MRKAANQWAESALMRELERQKAVERVSLGAIIEKPVDYQRNPGTTFLASDLSLTSMSKVEVLTTTQVDAGQISVPVVWSKADEAKNPTENQKINFTKGLLENAINSHDDILEQALFGTNNSGFFGLQTLVPTSGQAVVQGVDASVEAWWRNYAGQYLNAGTDIEAQMTTAWNTAAKGSGSQLAPTLIVSSAAAQALFEASQQPLQRWIDTDELKAGFKILGFKTARYVFSQYGATLNTNPIYFLNPKSFTLTCSKEAFRQKGDTMEIPNMEGYVFKIYSLVQATTNNKSRLAVITGH